MCKSLFFKKKYDIVNTMTHTCFIINAVVVVVVIVVVVVVVIFHPLAASLFPLFRKVLSYLNEGLSQGWLISRF